MLLAILLPSCLIIGTILSFAGVSKDCSFMVIIGICLLSILLGVFLGIPRSSDVIKAENLVSKIEVTDIEYLNHKNVHEMKVDEYDERRLLILEEKVPEHFDSNIHTVYQLKYSKSYLGEDFIFYVYKIELRSSYENGYL